jgi:hypothetical protein
LAVVDIDGPPAGRPVGVLWWAVSQGLVQSILEPGADEGRVAIYRPDPTPHAKPVQVAAVARGALPSAFGRGAGHLDGSLLRLEHGDASAPLELSSLGGAGDGPSWGSTEAPKAKVRQDAGVGRSGRDRAKAVVGLALAFLVLVPAGFVLKGVVRGDGADGGTLRLAFACSAILFVALFVAGVIGRDGENED